MPEAKEVKNKLVALVLLKFQPDEVKCKKSEGRMIELAKDPPKNCICLYTDGSAYGSPGESGAGIYRKTENGETIGGSFYMGEGNNNEAEGYALLLALDYLDYLWGTGDAQLADGWIIFSDSAGVVGYLLKSWACPLSWELGVTLRKKYYQIKKRMKLRIFWIRGHNDIPGNEEADKYAKTGAKGKTEMMGTDWFPRRTYVGADTEDPPPPPPPPPGCPPPPREDELDSELAREPSSHTKAPYFACILGIIPLLLFLFLYNHIPSSVHISGIGLPWFRSMSSSLLRSVRFRAQMSLIGVCRANPSPFGVIT